MKLNVNDARTQYALPPYRISIKRTDVLTVDAPRGSKTLPPLSALPPNTESVTLRTWTDQKIILTDAHCPVDNMLSEVVSQRSGLRR